MVQVSNPARRTTPVVAALLVMAMAAGALASAADGARVNINTATAEELTALPGVGPAIAQRIVEYRQKNGPFRQTVELMNVKGIGEKTFDRLKELVTVSAGNKE